jgi:hypothetical protein
MSSMDFARLRLSTVSPSLSCFCFWEGGGGGE